MLKGCQLLCEVIIFQARPKVCPTASSPGPSPQCRINTHSLFSAFPRRLLAMYSNMETIFKSRQAQYNWLNDKFLCTYCHAGLAFGLTSVLDLVVPRSPLPHIYVHLFYVPRWKRLICYNLIIPRFTMTELPYNIATKSMGFLFYLIYLSRIHTVRSIDTILEIINIIFHQHHCGDLWYQAALDWNYQ